MQAAAAAAAASRAAMTAGIVGGKDASASALVPAASGLFNAAAVPLSAQSAFSCKKRVEKADAADASKQSPTPLLLAKNL